MGCGRVKSTMFLSCPKLQPTLNQWDAILSQNVQLICGLFQVAQYLVPRIRLIASDRKSNSTYTRFLTGFKAYTKILAVINTSIQNLSLLMFALSFICHVITFVLSFVRMLLTAHLTPFRCHSRSFFVCATTAFLTASEVWPGCCHFGRGCSSKQGRTDISLRISQCVLKGWQL